jgi:DNA-directed RNA polymerase beta' subunit
MNTWGANQQMHQRHSRYRTGCTSGNGGAGLLPPPPLRRIVGLQFGLLTSEQVGAMATVHVRHSSTTERVHNKFGVNDIVMGPCDRGSRCVECHATMNDCVGHPGAIDLWMYVPSPFTVDMLKRVVECICLQCGQLLCPITPKLREELMSLHPKKRLEVLKKRCQKVMYCGQLHRATPKGGGGQAGKHRKGGPSKSADRMVTSDTEDDEEKTDVEMDDSDEPVGNDEESSSASESESEVESESEDTASESDDGGAKRKKRKPAKKKASAAAGGGAAADDPAEKKFGPSSKRGTQKMYAGSFNIHDYKQKGCGAPVAKFTRDGLRISATYCLPFEGDLRKSRWPVHNSWVIYRILRRMPEDQQMLMGFTANGATEGDRDLGPIRALLFRKLHVPPPIVRRKKEDPKSNSQDDNTQALRDVVMRSKKLIQRLRDDKAEGGEGVKTHAQLGSVNRTILWYCPPQGRCTCPTTTRFRCTCGMSTGRVIKCDERFCTDPEYCTCVPKSYLPLPMLTPELRRLYALREALELQHAGKRGAGTGTIGLMGPPAAKRPAKGWRDLLADVENALTTYWIGDINKKGAGRKDGRPGVSPWAGTTSTSNSLVKRDKAFAARFVGKHGRIRGTMYGKRCDKTARTVASGDLHQNVGQVGIPREIAETLTVCEGFQPFNRIRMIDRLRSNKIDYVKMENGDLYNTRFLNRDFYVMPYGSTCERHIENGDPVVWNRQPTLHKPSIEGAEALLLNHPMNTRRRRTLAINQCLTTGTNADFDGDELNLHLAQSQEARAETHVLMSAPQQIRSQQGDSVIIVLVQNSRLALHLLTDPTTYFRRDEFQQLLMQFGSAHKDKRIQCLFERAMLAMPAPAKVDPNTGEQWWSGVQVVSALLPPGVHYGNCIRNSEMLPGSRLAGKDVSHGESGNLIHAMVQDVGEEITVAWMSGFQRVLNAFLMNFGATMNPGDYEMREGHKTESLTIVEKARDWCHAHAADQPYDMRKHNAQERKINAVLERSRDLVAHRLTKDVEHRERYGWRRNGVLDLINSGAKGKPQHLIQMGAMVGQQMPLCGRVVANVAFFNRTVHTPEAHGYVPDCYRDGLSPWAFFCAAIGGRECLVSVGSSTPNIGYLQARLAKNLSDVHAKSDGSVRDCRSCIVQWQYGDDGKDPSYLESNDAKFFTPAAKCSPQLLELQRSILRSRAVLYDTSRYMPTKFLAPVNFKRMMDAATTHPANGRPLTPNEVSGIVDRWFQHMEKQHLLHPLHDPRYDLLLDAVLRDVLSPYHVAEKLALSESQLMGVLRHLEYRLGRAIIPGGEAVGTIASQSMGEPATQSTLNLFHMSGAYNTMTSVLSRLNDAVNCCRKFSTPPMTVMLKEPWCHRRDLAEMIARDVTERRLIEFVSDLQVLQPAAPPHPPFPKPCDTEWVEQNLELHPPRVVQWFRTLPSVRIEFNGDKCLRQHLHLMEIATAFQTFFKRGTATLSSSSAAGVWVLYIVLDNEHFNRVASGSGSAAARKSLSAGGAGPNAAATPAVRPSSGGGGNLPSVATSLTLTESAIVTCLHETIIRGIPKVSDSMVMSLEVKNYSEAKHEIQTHTEWAVITQGSNFEGLLVMPAVDFERCATGYVHDVYKMMGIEGARRWFDENIEDLVRGCRSKVDVRHTKLIADAITRSGVICPMTRNGLAQSTGSPTRLFFEDALESIKKAGVFSSRDDLLGVPESVLMGTVVPVGTGAVHLAEKPAQQQQQQAAHARVIGGIRHVPCRSRPFRFFQGFVPINRAGQLVGADMVTTRSPGTGPAVVGEATVLSSALTAVNHNGQVRWPGASRAVVEFSRPLCPNPRTTITFTPVSTTSSIWDITAARFFQTLSLQ